MNNYPDNIHQFDNDPRSPFYIEGPICPDCEEHLECDSQDEFGIPESYCPKCISDENYLDDDDEEE